MSMRALLTLCVSVLLGVAAVAPSAALAQLPGPPPGPPMLAGPPPGLGAGGPPPGLAGAPAAGLLPRGPRAYLRVTSRAVRLVSMVLPDCVVSIAAARPTFAVSKLAPRTTAPTATPATVTPATFTAMATGTGVMPRLLLTPMVDPTPPLTTAATTSAYRRYGYRRVLVCRGE
jgi:hypothetical protein